ncbi:hypothetical protein CW732_11665 [Olleya sp. Bg11-27]|nr:hypothetical protein CW732_11665 [Olleya sp. Bg11-27]
MPKLEDSVKGQKPFGVMIYEPPYTFLSAIAGSNREERINVVAYVRWCERRTPTILVGAVYSISTRFYLIVNSIVSFA